MQLLRLALDTAPLIAVLDSASAQSPNIPGCPSLRARHNLPAAECIWLRSANASESFGPDASIGITRDTIIQGVGFPLHTGQVKVSNGATAVISGVRLETANHCTGCCRDVGAAETGFTRAGEHLNCSRLRALCHASNASGYEVRNKCPVSCAVGCAECRSSCLGSAIVVRGGAELRVRGCTISNRTSVLGGAIYVQNARVHVYNTTMKHNVARCAGGAIFARSRSLVTISMTQISWNKVTGPLGDLVGLPGACGHGGAVLARGGSRVLLTNGSVLSHNVATYAGGGAYITINSTLQIARSSLEQNGADYSGAAGLSHGSQIHVARSVITDNVARLMGGAFVPFKNCTLTIGDGTMIMRNRALAQSGGGLLAYGHSVIVVTDSTMAYNYARMSGGAFCAMMESAVTVTNSTIAHNTADESGGAFLATMESAVTVTNSTIAHNTADESGGGAFVSANSTLVVTGSNVASNTALETGGGIGVNGFSDGKIVGSIISGNVAGVSPNCARCNGGGVACYADSVIHIADSTVTHNSVLHGAGGGVSVGEGSTMHITNSSVSHNNATYSGGGIDAGGGGSALFTCEPAVVMPKHNALSQI